MKDHNQSTSLRVARPRLLMLSHCVPGGADRGADRRRAWQLLKAFNRSHEVLLACLADGAVSLSQWRALHGLTRRIVIEPVNRLRRWGGAALRGLAPMLSQSLLMRGRLEQPVRQWSAEHDLDGVLCTRLGLIDAALLAGDGQRIVDHHAGLQPDDPRVAHATAWIISDPAQAATWAPLGKRTILLPASQPVREQPGIRLVTDEMDAPIALPGAALNKAA